MAPPMDADMDIDATEPLVHRVVDLGNLLREKWTQRYAHLCHEGVLDGIVSRDSFSKDIFFRYHYGGRRADGAKHPEAEDAGIGQLSTFVNTFSDELVEIGGDGVLAVREYRDAEEAAASGFAR